MFTKTLWFGLAILILACPLLADEDPAPAEEPEVAQATDKQARHELKIFKQSFDTEDIDFKLDAMIRLGKCVHKDVMKTLLTLLFKDPDPFVRAEAAKSLGYQIPFAELIGRKVTKILEDKDADPKILRELVRTIGTLNYRRGWELLVDLIPHDDDQVVVAVFKVLGEWKELRALQEMEEFWSAYPSEGSWSTGSVTVDTGAAGNTDAKAAKAKWMAKYGARRKQRARPECVKALKAAVLQITGEAIAKSEALRQWRSDHKDEIKRAERQRY